MADDRKVAERAVAARPTQIRISRRVRAALIVTALVVALFIVWRVPSAVTTTIGGFALALVLSFPVRFLSRFMPRGLAIPLSFLLVSGLLTLAALFLVPLIVEQFTALVGAIPSIASEVARYLNSTLAFLRERNLLRTDLDELTSRAGETLTNAARAVAGGVLGGAVGLVSGTLSLVLTLFGVVFIGAYVLVDVRTIKAAYMRAAPSGYRRDARDLWDSFGRSLSRYLGGLALILAVQGVVSATGLFLIGVPYPRWCWAHGSPLRPSFRISAPGSARFRRYSWRSPSHRRP